MDYKSDCPKERVELFKYVLDLNMPDRKKRKVFNHLYEEYKITYLMYKNMSEFIKGIKEQDLRGFQEKHYE